MNKLWPLCFVFLPRNSRKLIFTSVQILVSPHCICFHLDYCKTVEPVISLWDFQARESVWLKWNKQLCKHFEWIGKKKQLLRQHFPLRHFAHFTLRPETLRSMVISYLYLVINNLQRLFKLWPRTPSRLGKINNI